MNQRKSKTAIATSYILITYTLLNRPCSLKKYTEIETIDNTIINNGEKLFITSTIKIMVICCHIIPVSNRLKIVKHSIWKFHNKYAWLSATRSNCCVSYRQNYFILKIRLVAQLFGLNACRMLCKNLFMALCMKWNQSQLWLMKK